jgi:hypothetical protein
VHDAKQASASILVAGTPIVEDEMLDLAFDRFGRIWALGSAAIAIVDTAAPVTSPARSSLRAPSGGTR